MSNRLRRSLAEVGAVGRDRSLGKPKPDQATIENPYNLFFPYDVRNQLSRIKKKDSMLFEQLKKRFEKLRIYPECG